MVAILRMKNLNESGSKQVSLVPTPNSQNSVILGRSFSRTRNGLFVSVLLNTLDSTVSIQHGKKNLSTFCRRGPTMKDTKVEDIYCDRLSSLCQQR